MSSNAFLTLFQGDNILYRSAFIPGRLVNISIGNLLIWSRVNLILCPVISTCCETVSTLIQIDNISCRFYLILSRLVTILSGSLLIWSCVNLLLCPIIMTFCETSSLIYIPGGILQILSRVNHILCPIDNISSKTVIILIQGDNI